MPRRLRLGRVHLLTTLGAHELVDEVDRRAQLRREQVAVASVDEGAAVGVTDALRDQLGLHAGPTHERDRGVTEPMEAEVGDDPPLLVPVREASLEQRG